MEKVCFFPAVKAARLSGKLFRAGELRFDLQALPPDQRETAAFLATRFPAGRGAAPAATVKVVTAPGEKAYRIDCKDGGIAIRGGAELLGAAFQTLRQMLATDPEGAYLIPEGEVEDSPDYATRGLYLESCQGTDLMEMEDWREAIETAHALKLNQLTIGVYGCWCRRWLDAPEEFYLLAAKPFDFIESRRRTRHYSARRGGHVALDYQPVAAAKNLFPEIVRHARRFGITVTPHFNTLGHNTLLPRLIPAISAKHIDGSPKGLGFCLSTPQTLDTLKAIFAELIQSSGVDTFHIGLDEVFQLIGVDPLLPARKVSPWCRCPECRSRPAAELVVNYAVALVDFLRGQGIQRVSLWHDQLTRMGLCGDFERELRRRGLQDNVVVECWYYYNMKPEERKYVFPELESARKYAVPMAGFQFWGHFPDHSANIAPLLKQQKGRAAGTEAYGVYAPSFHYNNACLAHFAWNTDAPAEGFTDAYVAAFFPEDKFPGFKERLTALLDAERHGIGHLLFADALAENYPADRIATLTRNQPDLLAKLPELRALYRRTADYFKGLMENGAAGNLVPSLYVEARRCEYLCSTFAFLAGSLRRTPVGYVPTDKASFDVREILAETDAFIACVETCFPPYLVPHTLFFISMIRDFITDDIEGV